MPVGIAYHPIMLAHDTGAHPESAARLEAVVAHLQATGLWDRLRHIEVIPATTDDLVRVHTRAHIDRVARLATSGGGALDLDTVVSPRSDEAARYAAGAVISAVRDTLAGEVSSALALVRPPGHHATATRAMGFCLYNNVAVAARWALEAGGVQRLAIVDLDVHHGNGTAEAFADDPRVLYVSLHQYPLFPGTGSWREVGAGSGEGSVLNVPLPPHTGDRGYARAFERLVAPAAERFRPDLFFVSLGYDAHWVDPLAWMLLSLTGYRAMADRLVALAGALCQGRLVVALEGGYDPTVLAHGVADTLRAMMGEAGVDPLGPAREPEADVEPLLAAIAARHSLA